jgi:hypothetical protein
MGNATEKTKAYLCIGGPYDGRRYAPSHDRGLGFQVPKSVRTPTPFGLYNAAIMPATVESVTYVADRIRCASPDKEVWLWRPADQSMEATMKLLLERYEQANNIIWAETPFGH